LKSGYIDRGVFQPVGFGGYFGYRGKALAGGPALPVAVFFVLHGVKAVEFADGEMGFFVHFFQYYIVFCLFSS